MLECRRGLEPLLAEELSEGGFPVLAIAPGRVDTQLSGPLTELARFRLYHRAAFPLLPGAGRTSGGAGAPAHPASGAGGASATDAVTAAVIDALCSDQAGAILAGFTRGPIRYRIAWASGGHRRAQVWRIAREVAVRQPTLINDPTQSTWQARVVEDAPGPGPAPGPAPRVTVELEPRGLPDPRFGYRVADIPAASHPTIAAALARLAARAAAEVGPLEEDVVWDPFVGSALELVERARCGPVRSLMGSDTAPEALEAARANLAAAGLTADSRVRRRAGARAGRGHHHRHQPAAGPAGQPRPGRVAAGGVRRPRGLAAGGRRRAVLGLAGRARHPRRRDPRRLHGAGRAPR